MDIALGVASYGPIIKHGEMDAVAFIEAAAVQGFRLVELCDRVVRPDNRSRIASKLRELNVASPSFAVRNDFSTGALATELVKVREGLETAAAVGARAVRIWTGSGRCQDVRSNVLRGLVAAAEAARAHGIRLEVETHGGVSNDFDFMTEMVLGCADNIGICLDFGNVADSDKRDAAIKKFTPFVTHVHAKSYGFDEAGRERSFDFEGACAGLLHQGYTGIWVCEYEGCPFTGELA